MGIEIDEQISKSNALFYEQESSRYITSSSDVSITERVAFVALTTMASCLALTAVGLGDLALGSLRDKCLWASGCFGALAASAVLAAITILWEIDAVYIISDLKMRGDGLAECRSGLVR